MPRRESYLRAVLVVCLVISSVSPAGAEGFLDLYVGKSFTQPADVRVRQPSFQSDFTVEDVSFDDKSFDSPLYYGARAGYFFESLPWLGLAAEFFHFKMYGDTRDSRRVDGVVAGAPVRGEVPVRTHVQRFDISHGVNYMMVDALFRYTLLDDPQQSPPGRIQLYAGLGVGPVLTHAENRVAHVKGNAGYEIAGVGAQAFAGVRALVWRVIGVFAEYKVTHSSLNVGVASGRGRVDETSHHLIGGLTFHLPSF